MFHWVWNQGTVDSSLEAKVHFFNIFYLSLSFKPNDVWALLESIYMQMSGKLTHVIALHRKKGEGGEN